METTEKRKRGRRTTVDAAALVRLYFEEHLSVWEIHRRTVIPRETIRYHLRADTRFAEENRRRGREGTPGMGGRSGGRYGVTGGRGRTNVA